MERKTNILLIYTGGTIGMVKDYNSGALKAFDFEELIGHLPELDQLDCTLEGISFNPPIDSSNMNPGHWAAMTSIIERHYADHDGFVILHGSDTMSYSASALSFMLENLDKPVIFTGSQLPIGDLRTDAKENLITSIEIASLRENGRPVVQEVGLYFEYKLYRGNRSTKINAEHFQAFASLNHPPLVESGVHLKVHHENLIKNAGERGPLIVHKTMDHGIALLKLFPGLGREVLHGVLKIPGLKALILETYGAGNAPMDDWFLEELRMAIEKGLHIINVTQCSGGSVSMGQYETSEKLRQMQLINGKDITTEAAVAKAMFLLGTGVEARNFKEKFEMALRGEMA